MKAEIKGLANGDWRLCGDEELASSCRRRSNGMLVGATSQVKFKVLPFRVKIQGLALIGCAW